MMTACQSVGIRGDQCLGSDLETPFRLSLSEHVRSLEFDDLVTACSRIVLVMRYSDAIL